jgi:hypothetical protein
MLRKFAVAMIATTMLAAPALAAEKPAATAPAATAGSAATPAASTTSKTSGTAPAAEVKTIKADKNLKAAPGKGEAKATDKDVGGAPTAGATSATDKTLKTVKTVKTVVHHRTHSYHWYMVHRGRHPGHVLASTGSKPVKHVSVHRPHQETGQQVVKTNKDASGKATQ